MTGNPPKLQLEPSIRTTLAALRGRIRRYVWIEGMALAIMWLGVAFWISLAIDWFFEPPALVRGLILAAVLLVFAGVIVQRVLRRAWVPLSDRNMAMLLERRFPQFRESLLTAVELSERRPSPKECNPILLARTCRLAAEPIRDLRLDEVINPYPRRQAVTAAVLLAATVVLLALASPAVLEIWTRRNLLFSNELWPRRTRLVIDGFDGGVVKVARGADLDILAKADLAKPLVPQAVEVRYWTDGGSRGRATMAREGAADPQRDRFQHYTHTFRGVLAPIHFDLYGGDDAVRDLHIEVVDSPTITEMVLDCRFPPYMGRNPRTLPVSGAMQIPAGTEVAVRGRSNKDLVRVEVQSALDDSSQPPDVLEMAGSPDPRLVEYRLGRLDGDKTLRFTLLDADGIKSREPVRLTLAALADEPPKLAVRLRGIGTAITSQAQLPAAGRITDDYGVAKTWFEYLVDDQDAQNHALPTPPGNPTDLKLDQALELRDLKLRTGQKLLVSVKAADRYDLGDRPNVGASERWLLEVVTPEQLRAMLESRELVLRQRFEALLEEVVDTRDSLLRIDFASDDRQESGPEKPDTAAEPGDQSQTEPVTPQRLLAMRNLRVQRASQNSGKNAHELLGVAEAFEEIRLELINNRIDTTELRMRLEQGIIGPLQKIGVEMFPELERRLNELQSHLADPNLGPQDRDRAREQADAILLAMRQVLSRMIELEDFNEAVELLRQIVELQEKLNDQTKQRHKGRLRDLLE